MFSGVKQMIPALLSLSAFATAAFQRAPGAISLDDIHGFSLFTRGQPFVQSFRGSLAA
jgi:hypothetical protein